MYWRFSLWDNALYGANTEVKGPGLTVTQPERADPRAPAATPANTAAPARPAAVPPKPAPAPVREPARPAQRRGRHRWITLSFLVLVALPVLAGAVYLYTRAADQYASTVGFSVRTEDFSSPIELFGGITNFASSGVSDSDILYEFIDSQEMVELLEARLSLSDLYAIPDGDPVFAFDSTGSIEDLHRYWQRMVRIVYDPGTQLIEVRALAFRPEDATAITTAILEEGARLIDELSAIAQDDTTEFAREELERGLEELREIGAALRALSGQYDQASRAASSL